MYDIFLSHSSQDQEITLKIRDDLIREGFTVCVDYDILPDIQPDAVTEETAEKIRTVLRNCRSLIYVITDKSVTSRWMPWELGFFDGVRGRIFIYPVDEQAEKHAKGIEYLRIYPQIPFSGRMQFLKKNIPLDKDTGNLAALIRAIEAGSQAPFKNDDHPGIFDFADQEQTQAYRDRITAATNDPAKMLEASRDIGQAWLRLWGLLPDAPRPGKNGGK